MGKVNHIIDKVELLHDHSIIIDSRTIYLTSAVDNDSGDEHGVCYVMTMKFLKNLKILEEISSDPVTVILNTLGGDVWQGLAIYDAIKVSPCAVTIIVQGAAMSMGAILLQAGDCRKVMPNSVIMFHAGRSSGIESNPHEVLNYAQFDKKTGSIADKIIYDRINEKRAADGMANLSLHKFKAMLLDGAYLTAKEAVDMGLADEIIGA